MDLGIKGKVALVTGASAGLGFAAATQLAKENVRVAINSRSEDNLKDAAQRVFKETGNKPAIFAGDISIEGVAEDIVEKVSQELGSIDILVANAGGPPSGLFESHSKETWRKSVDLTLFSSINLSRVVIPNMVKKKWGRIIFITSLSVKQPSDVFIISSTLRTGLTGFAKTISNEYAQYGITINTVCPGFTKTEMMQKAAVAESEITSRTVEDIYNEWQTSIPAGRLGNPEELAALIAFLASKKAAYITGSSILVDGGLYKGLL